MPAAVLGFAAADSMSPATTAKPLTEDRMPSPFPASGAAMVRRSHRSIYCTMVLIYTRSRRNELSWLIQIHHYQTLKTSWCHPHCVTKLGFFRDDKSVLGRGEGSEYVSERLHEARISSS